MSKEVLIERNIFIDTNIYLRFFDPTSPEYKKHLLKTLLSLKDRIFITKQIVDEVYRNKLKVFQSGFKDSRLSFQIAGKPFPEQIGASKASQWNDDFGKIKKSAETSLQKISQDQEQLFFDLLEKISRSEDPVSKALEPLFMGCVAATEEDYEKAKKRRNLGNPPGKPEDPIGDQISWEQFLEGVGMPKHAWIISHDSDYMLSIGNNCFLNSFLHNELTRLTGGKTDIRCFDKLSDALQDISKAEGKIEKLPSKEALAVVAKEEETPVSIDTEPLRFYIQPQMPAAWASAVQTAWASLPSSYFSPAGANSAYFPTMKICQFCNKPYAQPNYSQFPVPCPHCGR